jgi:ubiquinone/menaquinone biosynthesis C-methylase UbiE
MPNGYYSTAVSLAYARGFELVMLGRMTPLRQRMAQSFRGCTSVLDVGCGAGHLAEAMHDQGATDVWGVDPCPYALTVAAARVPGIRFTQGLAEDTGFASGRFDGLGVCFVLHELPRAALEQALAEFRRVLRPGGTLVIAEPSPVHVRGSWWNVVRKYGFTGGYYKGLARLVFEPFLEDWLALDLRRSLEEAGFHVTKDTSGVPFRELAAVSR